MKKIGNDIDNILSLDNKKKLLKQYHMEDLLDLFKETSYKPTYRTLEQKKVSLDQQIAISIGQAEKDYIKNELMDIRRVGPGISISSFIRNRSVSPIDINEFAERALVGLKDLNSSKYNEKELLKEKANYLKLIDDIDENSEEREENTFFYQKKLAEVNQRLEEVRRELPKRSYRLSGRVTLNEANVIRWRAARLSLTVADYMRFLVFSYLPYSDADRHLSVDARKRFYISILDVQKNGWGNPPVVNECPQCARLLHDNKILREQIARLQAFTKQE